MAHPHTLRRWAAERLYSLMARIFFDVRGKSLVARTQTMMPGNWPSGLAKRRDGLPRKSDSIRVFRMPLKIHSGMPSGVSGQARLPARPRQANAAASVVCRFGE